MDDNGVFINDVYDNKCVGKVGYDKGIINGYGCYKVIGYGFWR